MMIRIDAVVPQNDIRAISDGLKAIHVGGITIQKVRGRGKTAAPRSEERRVGKECRL